MRRLLHLFDECSGKTFTKFLTCLEDISNETAAILKKKQRDLKDKTNMNSGIGQVLLFLFAIILFKVQKYSLTLFSYVQYRNVPQTIC